MHCPTTRTPFAPAPFEPLESRRLFAAGFLTPAPAYVVPTAPGVETTPLITVGESVPETNNPAGSYQMVGIPDGLGAYDNGDGTFTVLMNHELRPDRGSVRDHGSRGAFVSRWVLDKATGSILSGDDLVKQVYLWDSVTGSYIAATTAFNRLCSADLPDVTAFYDPATGLGTTARIFMNGEETNSGRAFAHVVTGPEAGTSWELPRAGKYAWENHVASPFPQAKTVVMGLDDSRREFATEAATEPSELYVWVGNKLSGGTEVDKAGLTSGILHGMRVGAPGSYDANESTVASGERFELVPLSDQANNATFGPLQAESMAESITQFRRVEDGHWDVNDPNVFYFVTTDQFGGRTRLWRLTFDDVRTPEAGGRIEIAVDSPAGVPGEMFDNMTVNYGGDVLLQEDPGNQTYLAKLWQHDTSSGDLVQIAQHNPRLFDPAYAGADKAFLTQDEESSGIIDLSDILGPGYYLADVQAHYALVDPLVEGGQLFLMNTNVATATLNGGVLDITGTVNDDRIDVGHIGNDVVVSFNGRTLGTFDKRSVASIRASGFWGDDRISVNPNVQAAAVLEGGPGDDVLSGRRNRDTLLD